MRDIYRGGDGEDRDEGDGDSDGGRVRDDGKEVEKDEKNTWRRVPHDARGRSYHRRS